MGTDTCLRVAIRRRNAHRKHQEGTAHELMRDLLSHLVPTVGNGAAKVIRVALRQRVLVAAAEADEVVLEGLRADLKQEQTERSCGNRISAAG